MTDDQELLREFAQLSMQLQEEYLRKAQDFSKQEMLSLRWSAVRNEILQRMR